MQLCMLSDKAYHGSVSELKGASALQVTGSSLPARPKTSGKGTEEFGGGSTHWEVKGKGQD